MKFDTVQSRPRQRWLGLGLAASTAMLKIVIALVVFFVIVGGWLALAQARQHAADLASPLPGGGGRQGACVLWFMGSSSMHRWSALEQDMAPWIAKNRGVNGATLDEIVQRFGHEPPGHHPEAIIFYAGENDIAAGVSATAAVASFRRFVAIKRKVAGNTPMLVISVKPSPTRWRNLPVQISYNKALSAIAISEPDIVFINTFPLFLVQGHPGNFYVEDGIHVNTAGYQIWTHAVRDALQRDLSPTALQRCINDTLTS